MTIKLNGSDDGSVSLTAPADTSPSGSDIELTLPTTAGSANQFVKNSGTAGELEYSSMVETATGVGIGNSSPQGELHVGSAVSFADSGVNNVFANTSTHQRLVIAGGDSHTTDIQFRKASDTGNKGIIRYDVNNNMRFYTDDTERVRINDAGELLVGKTTGATTTNGLTITSGGRLYDTIPNGNTYHVYDSTNSLYRFYVKSDGGIVNYSSNNSSLSDERSKKNIESLDSTWECLKHWELKKFHYSQDSDTDDKKYGVIAQQVAPHCPEVIDDFIVQPAEDAILDEDGNVVAPATEEVVRMGVKEGQMMWMAIKALQEAQDRIEALETKVAALEAGS